MDPGISIYVIGAQCTGKTTLVNALFDTIHRKYKDTSICRITEVARNVLRSNGFTRDDISDNPCKALEIQSLILSTQFETETRQPNTPVISDRSGIDPIVYAIKYGPSGGRKVVENTRQWQYLCSRMRHSLVVLCPPHQEWLTDDGIRLVASDWKDWQEMHMIFCQVLTESCIPYIALPDGLLKLQDRVDFVFELWTTSPRMPEETTD